MRGTMWDCYVRYYQPFGELLTDMERAGMLVDTAHLAAMEKVSPLPSPPQDASTAASPSSGVLRPRGLHVVLCGIQG
jgi:hypothetical protein